MDYYERNIETKNRTRNLPQRIVIGEKEMFEKKIFKWQFKDYFINIGSNVASNIQSCVKTCIY